MFSIRQTSKSQELDSSRQPVPVDVCSNLKLLNNIISSKRSLVLHYNASTATVTKKGELKGLWYGMVWYGMVWYGALRCGMVWYCVV